MGPFFIAGRVLANAAVGIGEVWRDGGARLRGGVLPCGLRWRCG